MQLTYRGNNYELNSDQLTDLRFRSANVRQNEKAKTQSLNAILSYRGATYRVQPAIDSPVTQPATVGRTLMYRGMSYRIEAIAQPQPQLQSTEAVAAPASVENQVRSLVHSHHCVTKQRQQTMLSRAANAAGLTTDISGYSNQVQGEEHSSFWTTYDRSHVAMS